MRFFDQDLLTGLASNWPTIAEDADLFTTCFSGRVVQATIDRWRALLVPGGDTAWLTFGTAYREDLRDRAQVIAVHSDRPPSQEFLGRRGLSPDVAESMLEELVTLYITTPNFELLRPIDVVLYAVGVILLPKLRDIGYEHAEYRGANAIVQDAQWLPERVYACQQTWGAVGVVAAPESGGGILKPISVSMADVTPYQG